LTLAVLVFTLGWKIRKIGEKTWIKITAWILWALAVSMAESRNILQVEHIHYFQYGILGAILWRPCRKNILLVILIGGLVGACDELLQGLVKTRTMDWADALYNLLGVLAGGYIASAWIQVSSKQVLKIHYAGPG
ncbi:MAG: VanZ family protein, partial [Deltaproteobacteria bacterium]|nr:VanZ family protein [Deltaproteobacteria bacterium]